MQKKALSLFCKQAKAAEYELWIELPYALKSRQDIEHSLDFIDDLDFLICGPPCNQEYPSIIPFKSSISQSILRADTCKPWAPRFIWSKQIAEYENAFKEPEDIANFKLSPALVEYFQYNLPEILSVEEFEQRVGSINLVWGQQ